MIGAQTGGEYAGAEDEGAARPSRREGWRRWAKTRMYCRAPPLSILALSPGISTSQATFFLLPEFSSMVWNSCISAYVFAFLGREAGSDASLPGVPRREMSNPETPREIRKKEEMEVGAACVFGHAGFLLVNFYQRGFYEQAGVRGALFFV